MIEFSGVKKTSRPPVLGVETTGVPHSIYSMLAKMTSSVLERHMCAHIVELGLDEMLSSSGGQSLRVMPGHIRPRPPRK
jgi:hypothetical protein